MGQSQLPPGTTPETATRILRFVVAAMSLGLVLATVVFAFVRPQERAGDPAQERIFLLALGVLVVGCFVGWMVFRKVTLDQLRRRWVVTAEVSEESELVQPFFTQHFVGAALSEGPGLMSAVLYFLTGSVVGLAGVVVALYVLTRFYPRDDSFRRFVQAVTGGGTAPA